MKATAFFCRSLLLTFTFAAPHLVWAQGEVTFTNLPGNEGRRIYVLDESTGQLVGADGTTYRIALYWAPSGTVDEAAFVQVGAPTSFLTAINAGLFFGGTRTINTATPGPVVAFQCRAWAIAYGDSYEIALSQGIGTGKGPIFEMKTKDPFNPLEIRPAISTASGFRGFTILVPEPSTATLCLLSACSLLLLRRRRQRHQCSGFPTDLRIH